MTEVVLLITEDGHRRDSAITGALAAFSASWLKEQPSEAEADASIMMTSTFSDSSVRRTLIFQSLEQATSFLSFLREQTRAIQSFARLFEGFENRSPIAIGDAAS